MKLVISYLSVLVEKLLDTDIGIEYFINIILINFYPEIASVWSSVTVLVIKLQGIKMTDKIKKIL